MRYFNIKFNTILLFSFLFFYCSHSIDLRKIEDFCQRYKPYQDIIISNTVVYRGWNSDYCALRYSIVKDIIMSLIRKNKKKLKLLDLGAAQGYFSFKLSYDFDLISFMIENGQSASKSTAEQSINFLEELCFYNQDTSKVFLLTSTLNYQAILEFGEHEHVDIVLALSIIHHLEDWKSMIDALICISNVIIIEIPIPNIGDLSDMIGLDQLAQMHHYIQLVGGQHITDCPRYYQGQMSAFYIIGT